jgi:hypothetical protein
MNNLDKLVEWFKKRVSIHKYEEHHLKFIMEEYAKIYHAEQLNLFDSFNPLSKIPEGNITLTERVIKPLIKKIK